MRQAWKRKTLGRRSEQTEAQLSAFLTAKAASAERLTLIKQQLDEQARLNKALRLGRVPRVVARILRQLDAARVRDAFVVLGTQALYAYESVAGAQLLAELLASGDVDLLFDSRRKLTLVANKLHGKGLLGLLKKADRTFECVRKRGFRVANAGQFMVDLLIAPRHMKDTGPVSFGGGDVLGE